MMAQRENLQVVRAIVRNAHRDMKMTTIG